MPITISPHLAPSIIRELTNRANRTPRDRLASEFIGTLKKARHHTARLVLSPLSLVLNVPNAEMTEEELVRRYMSNLGQPMTQEQWDETQAQMRELEKLPLDEVLRRHKEALGDLF